VTRIPIRLRLTLAFAVAMALVLSAVGTFLVLRLGASLQEQLEDQLDARAQTLSAVASQDDELVSALQTGGGEEPAQAFAADGTLLASSPVAASKPLVTRAEMERARAGGFFVTRESVEALDGEPARILLEPAGSLVIVVSASLEDREEAVEGLQTQLFIIGPLALLAASLAGYLLAGAALRPVEAMRRRADEISAEELGRRLPLPAARDEIRRLGETLNAMLQRLEDGLARERRFVADASHELRTPLALLQTELELARRRPRSREELDSALRSAAEEVDRLVRLSEDLLVLARADEGRLKLTRTSIEARELLEAVARRFAPRAAVNGRELAITAPTDLPIVGDRLRLEQALGNLVDNAFRHGDGTVRLEAGSVDGSVVLSVTDEGDGFPTEFLPRAFERFARADEARGGAAAGLGLAIVDAIALAHGGSARAANGSGRGAFVSLTLPRTA
jgi:heavy metal sensor kinase